MKYYEKLPQHFDDFEEIGELTDTQRFNLLARMNYILEVIDDIKKLDFKQSIDEIDFALDSLELDVSIAQDLDSYNENKISPWIIHRFWTSDFEACDIRSIIDGNLLQLLERPPLSVFSDLYTIQQWLLTQASLLEQCITMFFNSTDFIKTTAAHLAIDIALAELLVSLYKLRLNDLKSSS